MRVPMIVAAALSVLGCNAKLSEQTSMAVRDLNELVLICEGDSCSTPIQGIGLGTFEEWRFAASFRVPPGWKLVGPAGDVAVGDNVFSVETTAWDANSLTCKWYGKGTYRLYGPGGSVNGYCSVKAQYQ